MDNAGSCLRWSNWKLETKHQYQLYRLRPKKILRPPVYSLHYTVTSGLGYQHYRELWQQDLPATKPDSFLVSAYPDRESRSQVSELGATPLAFVFFPIALSAQACLFRPFAESEL